MERSHSNLVCLCSLFFCLFSASPLSSTDDLDPWERDVASYEMRDDRTDKNFFPSSWLISFHQQVISLGDGPRSHFYPTSSEYMRQAVRKHGSFGFFLGMDRLLRENSEQGHYSLVQVGFSIRKFDPVPSFTDDPKSF